MATISTEHLHIKLIHKQEQNNGHILIDNYFISPLALALIFWLLNEDVAVTVIVRANVSFVIMEFIIMIYVSKHLLSKVMIKLKFEAV